MSATKVKPSGAQDAEARVPVPVDGALVMEVDRLRTTIQPEVVAKIAGLAIREVPGVHALVPFGPGQAISNMARSLRGGALLQRLCIARLFHG